jgi:nucleoside-diphosphate-sugar epimerase
MRVLLTGAGGFLGQRIARSLLEVGVEQLRLQYRTVAPQGVGDAQAGATTVDCQAANLLDMQRVQSLVEGVDCIVHAAAGMRGAPADMFANTVVATRNLLQAARAAAVRRFVLISSFAVYRSGALSKGMLLDETCPLEPSGLEKGHYGFVKTRQEQLVTAFTREHGIECVLLRPGVIHGPGAGSISPRVGLRAFGRFFSLGGGALLPLTYVDNCADAVALAAVKAPAGSAFSVVDDDLPSCREFLQLYRRHVEKLSVVSLPYPLLLLASRLLQSYHRRSKGQLPALLTPYTVRSMYRPLRYGNAALKALGWTIRVPTPDALRASMSALAAGRTSQA